MEVSIRRSRMRLFRTHPQRLMDHATGASQLAERKGIGLLTLRQYDMHSCASVISDVQTLNTDFMSICKRLSLTLGSVSLPCSHASSCWLDQGPIHQFSKCFFAATLSCAWGRREVDQRERCLGRGTSL